jgi:hypothetical protein
MKRFYLYLLIHKLKLHIMKKLLFILSIIATNSLMAQFQIVRNYYGKDAEQRGTCVFSNNSSSINANGVSGAGLVQFNNPKLRIARSFALNNFDLQGNITRSTEYIPESGENLEVKQIRKINNNSSDVIVGGTNYHNTFNGNTKVPFLMRIDALNGNVVWTAELNSLLNIPNDDVTLVDFDITNREDIIFVAKRFKSNTNITTMIVGNLEGTTGISSSWTEEFLPTGYDNIIPRALTLVKGKNIVAITGSAKEQNSTKTAAFLTLININGMHLSTQVLRPLDESSGEGIGICEDSNSSSILVTGSELEPSNSPSIDYKRLFVARIDYNGTLNNYSVYENPFGYSNSWVGTKIEVASNGTIIVAGANYTLPSAISYNEGMFLVNVDGYAILPATGYLYQGTPINLYYESLVTEGNLAWMGSTYLQGQNIYQIITDLNGNGAGNGTCPKIPINQSSLPPSNAIGAIEMKISPDPIQTTVYPFKRGDVEFGNFFECSVGAKVAYNNPNTTLLSPNPAIDRVNLNSENGDIKEVSLFDITGKLVIQEAYSEGQYNLTLDTQELVNGTYIVHVKAINGTIDRKKLVIQK